MFVVALRKESVDRNKLFKRRFVGQCVVALRKESVDRNSFLGFYCLFGLWSLSARRAWIEIPITGEAGLPLTSLSARRAWIEIRCDRLACR